MYFSPEELADVERSLKRLLLAAQDMVECAAAANYLRERDDIPGDVRRALETAIPVASARPWGSSNTIGALQDHWLPTTSELLALHEELIWARNKVYAHTDEEVNARWVHNLSEHFRQPGPVFVPAWRPLNADLLHPHIPALAGSQTRRFAEGVSELQSRLAESKGPAAN